MRWEERGGGEEGEGEGGREGGRRTERGVFSEKMMDNARAATCVLRVVRTFWETLPTCPPTHLPTYPPTHPPTRVPSRRLLLLSRRSPLSLSSCRSDTVSLSCHSETTFFSSFGRTRGGRGTLSTAVFCKAPPASPPALTRHSWW